MRSVLILILFSLSLPSYGDSKIDALLGTRIEDTDMQVYTKAALASQFPDREVLVADVIAMPDRQLHAIHAFAYSDVKRYLTKMGLKRPLFPFEIESLRRTGHVPAVTLESSIERFTIRFVWRAALMRLGARTIEDVTKLSDEQLDSTPIANLKIETKTALDIFLKPRVVIPRPRRSQSPVDPEKVAERISLREQKKATTQAARDARWAEITEQRAQNVQKRREELIAKARLVEEIEPSLPAEMPFSAAENPLSPPAPEEVVSVPEEVVPAPEPVKAEEAVKGSIPPALRARTEKVRAAVKSPTGPILSTGKAKLAEATIELLRDKNITTLEQLEPKSILWTRSLFGILGNAKPKPDLARRSKELSDYIAKTFGRVAYDDLESALLRGDLGAPIDSALMRITSSVTRQLGSGILTVGDLIKRIDELAAEKGHLKFSDDFRQLRMRIDLIRSRCPKVLEDAE